MPRAALFRLPASFEITPRFAARLVTWWKARQRKARMARQSLALNKDEELIAELIPELSHRGMLDGTVYTFDQIDEFRKNCTPAELHEFVRRLKASMANWREAGVAMPYWENLVVLRQFQADMAEKGKPPKVRL